MSTIVRSSSDSRSGRDGRAAHAGRADGAERAGHGERTGRAASAGRGGRESQRALSGRTLRVRNACVRHAAARLGLALPTDADLRELAADTTLAEAVNWWSARAGAVEPADSGRSVSVMLRAAVIAVMTLAGLALSYGQAQ